MQQNTGKDSERTTIGSDDGAVPCGFAALFQNHGRSEQGRLLTEYRKEVEAVKATLQPMTTPLTPARMQPLTALERNAEGLMQMRSMME